MNVSEGKTPARGTRPRGQAPRQQPYRRTSAIVNERPDGKPIIFGYGRHLTKREKEHVQHVLAYGALALVVTASLAVIAVTAIYSNFIYPNQAVAWVNGHGVSRHDRTVLTNYFTAVENAASQQGNTQNLGDPGSLAVAQLQKNLLASVDAKQQFGITVSMADARAKLAKDLASGGTSMATFTNNLKTSNISVDDYLRLVEEPQVLEQKVGVHLTQGNAKVADQWHYARISVSSQKTADSILQQLLRGASFATLAKKDSLDKQLGASGGDVGWERTTDSGTDPLLATTFLKYLQSMEKSHARYQVVKYSSTVYYVIEYLGHDPRHPLSTSQQQQDQTTAFNTWYGPLENKARFNPALPAGQQNSGGSTVSSPGSSSSSSGH